MGEPIKCEGKCQYNEEPEPEDLRELLEEEQIIMEKLISEKFNVKDDGGVPMKNPFVCKSDFEVRVSLDKDPRRAKGNTDYVNLYQIGNDYKIHNQFDNNLNYDISKTIKKKSYEEMSIINKYDYVLDSDTLNSKRTDGKAPHKDPLPLSFIQINNERDGAIWYKENYPKIPEDLIPIIARYHWGEPITKKSIKNEKKKIIKKASQKGLKIEHKKVSVSFD